MYLAFLYVISNEGVDTESSYPFKGKVATRNNTVAVIRNHCHQHTIFSNPAATMPRTTVEQAFRELFPSLVVVSPTWRQLLLMLDL